MWDDDNDKRVARSQAIGLALMTVMLLVGLQYIFPQPQQPAPQSEPGVADQAPADPLDSPDRGDGGGRPDLPPVATDAELASVEAVALETPNLRLQFTPVGARLQHAELVVDNVDLVAAAPEASPAAAIYPLGMRFSDPALQDELDRRLFTVEEQTDRSVTFALTLPDRAIVRKTISLTDNPHVLDMAISYENISGERQILGRDDGTPAYVLNWGPEVATPVQSGAPSTLIWRASDGNSFLNTSSFEPDEAGPENALQIEGVEWVALQSAYFLAAFKPGFEGARPWCIGTWDRYRFGVAVPRQQLEAGESTAQSFQIYLGPNHLEQLETAWPGLETALRFFQYPRVMDWFAKLLLSLLNWFYDIIPNFGVAIILMTLLVRTAMIPLTLKQMRSMKSMQLLQPEMEAIREKYKDEPQQMQQKILAMYRERGVNPVGGCLPLLLQMPIFFAFYRMLWYAYELYQAPFLWIKDLSAPDCLFPLPAAFQEVPFVGGYLECFNLLPLLNIGVMILSVRMMPMSGPMQNPQQKMMMTIMPVVFGLICYPFAAGLNLYILISTVVGILQNRLIRVSSEDIPERKKRTRKKKQNMYAAYQARKREQKKKKK